MPGEPSGGIRADRVEARLGRRLAATNAKPQWPHRLGKRHLVIWLADGQAIEINATSDRGDGLAARDDLEVGEPLVTEPINTSNKTSNNTSNTKIGRRRK